MRSITIREFQQNIYKCVDKLPFVVTRRGKPYFVVNVATLEGVEANVATLKRKDDNNVATFISEMVKGKVDHPGMCKHGSALGLCKRGCV